MDIVGYSHIHTKYTDGDLSLPEIKKLFLGQKINFAFVTEHREYFKADKYERLVAECQQLSDDKILFIPGLEVAAGRNHILILGTKRFYEGDDLVELIKKYKSEGCLIIWAHPHRNKYQIEDAFINLLDGLEIWNSSYDTKHSPRYSSLSYFKNKAKRNWLAFCGLDFHRASHLPGPKIFLSVNNLCSEEIMRKIKLGEYKFGSNEQLSREELISRRYYHYFFSNLFFLAILKTFKAVNSLLLTLNIKMPVKIKNYFRKTI